MNQNDKENEMSVEAHPKHLDRRTRAPVVAAPSIVFLFHSGCGSSSQLGSGGREAKKMIVVYQPSHQSDTGVNFNEALVWNGIAEAALAASTGVVQVHKVWSYDVDGLHHAREGSNTKIEHTAMVDSLGRISWYAYELTETNKHHPDIFIAVQTNGATNRNACWGYVHEGDAANSATGNWQETSLKQFVGPRASRTGGCLVTAHRIAMTIDARIPASFHSTSSPETWGIRYSTFHLAGLG